jgi:hypothetical protein
VSQYLLLVTKHFISEQKLQYKSIMIIISLANLILYPIYFYNKNAVCNKIVRKQTNQV